MSETILGYPGLVEQGSRIIRDPVRGVSMEVLYEGTKDAVLAAYQTIPSTTYVECDTLRPGPKGTLFIRTPDHGGGQTESQTSYELLPTSTQRSAYENPRVQAAIGKTEVKRVKDVMTGKLQLARGSNGQLIIPFTGNARTLFDYVTAGSDTFFTSEIVFRVTDVIANTSEQAIAYANSSRTYTSAQLIAETNPGQFYQQGIHAAEASMLADVYGGAAPEGTILGWLKHIPSTVNVPNNKRAVSVEYWLGAWPTLLYLPKA